MNKIVVRGPARLSGEITVGGSKNAALPILFATVITGGVSRISNPPDIGDVRVAIELLKELGVRVERRGNVAYIDSRGLLYKPPRADLISKIRASAYLIGSCLSRFGVCDIGNFGGCNFGSRPIDLHIFAAERLGARLSDGRLKASELCGCEISFSKPSVGATVNAILMSASAKGETVIRGFAKEPHIDSLIEFLTSAGADISRDGQSLVIKGKSLHGGDITIVGDMIEAGTYLAAGVMTDGEVSVRGCPVYQLDALVAALERLGAEIETCNGLITARRGKEVHPIAISALPYPGFPTDLQPIMASLLATAAGGMITDRVWTSRFGYLEELRRFGIRSRLSGCSAIIESTRPTPAMAEAPDLRGGMACLLTALSANGESIIYSPDVIMRGYENLEEKLLSLGARIKIC